MTVLLPGPAGARVDDSITHSTDTVWCDRNESAYPPLPAVVSALRRHTTAAHHDPSFRPDHLRRAIAEHTGSDTDHITVGAGATAVLAAIMHDSATRRRATGHFVPRIATPAPTFEGFALLADMIGLVLDTTPLLDDGRPDLAALAAAAGPETAALVVCSPHNPTGAVLTDDEVRAAGVCQSVHSGGPRPGVCRVLPGHARCPDVARRAPQPDRRPDVLQGPRPGRAARRVRVRVGGYGQPESSDGNSTVTATD